MKLGSLIRGKASGLKSSFKSELGGNDHSKADHNGSGRKLKSDHNNGHRKTDIDTSPQRNSSSPGECI